MSYSSLCNVTQPYSWYRYILNYDMSKIELLNVEDGLYYPCTNITSSRTAISFADVNFTQAQDYVKIFVRFPDEIDPDALKNYWTTPKMRYLYHSINDAITPAGNTESYILSTKSSATAAASSGRAFYIHVYEGYDPEHPWQILYDRVTTSASVNEYCTYMSVSHSAELEVYGKVYNETQDILKGEYWKFEDSTPYCCPAWHAKTYPTNSDYETTAIFVKNITTERVAAFSVYTGTTIFLDPGEIKQIDVFTSSIMSSAEAPVYCSYIVVDTEGVNCLFDANSDVTKLFTLETSRTFMTSFYAEGYFMSVGNPVVKSPSKLTVDNWPESEHSYHTGETYFHGVINDPNEWQYLINTYGYHEPYTKEGSDSSWCQNGHAVTLPTYSAVTTSETNATYLIGQTFCAHQSPTYHEYEWKRGSNWVVGATFICPCIKITNKCRDNTFFVVRSYHGNIELHYGESAYVPKNYVNYIDFISGKYSGYLAHSDGSGVYPIDAEATKELRDYTATAVNVEYSWSSGITNIANVFHTKTSYPITDYLLSDITFTKGGTERNTTEVYSSRYLGSVYLSANSDSNAFDDPTLFTFHLNESNRARLDSTEHIAAMYRDNTPLTSTTLCSYPMKVTETTYLHGETSALINLFDTNGTEYFYQYATTDYYIDRYNYKLRCTSIADRVLVYGQTCVKDKVNTKGGLYPMLANVVIPIPSYDNKIKENEYRQTLRVICPVAKKIKMTVDGVEVFRGSLNPNEYKTLYQFPDYGDYAIHDIVIEEVIGAESHLYLKNGTMDITYLQENYLSIETIYGTFTPHHFDTTNNYAVFYCGDAVPAGSCPCTIKWRPTDVNAFINNDINILYRDATLWPTLDALNVDHTTVQNFTFVQDGDDTYFLDSLFDITTPKNYIPEPTTSGNPYVLVGKTSDYILSENDCSVRALIYSDGEKIGQPIELPKNVHISMPNEGYLEGQYTIKFQAHNPSSETSAVATSSITESKSIIERTSWGDVGDVVHTQSSFLHPTITVSTENVYSLSTRNIAIITDTYGVFDYFALNDSSYTYKNVLDNTIWEDYFKSVWYISDDKKYLQVYAGKPNEHQNYEHQIVTSDNQNVGISFNIKNAAEWSNIINAYHIAAPLSNCPAAGSLPEWCVDNTGVYVPVSVDNTSSKLFAFIFTGYDTTAPKIVQGYSYYGGNSKLNNKYVLEPCYELKTDLVSTVGLSAVGTNLSGKKDIYMSAGRDNLYRFENNLHSGPSKYITVYKNGVQVGRYVCAAWRYTTFRVANVLPGDLVEIKSDPEDSKPKINVGGVWKDSDGYISIGGTWKKINKVYVYKDGVWKECK